MKETVSQFDLWPTQLLDPGPAPWTGHCIRAEENSSLRITHRALVCVTRFSVIFDLRQRSGDEPQMSLRCLGWLFLPAARMRALMWAKPFTSSPDSGARQADAGVESRASLLGQRLSTSAPLPATSLSLTYW